MRIVQYFTPLWLIFLGGTAASFLDSFFTSPFGTKLTDMVWDNMGNVSDWMETMRRCCCKGGGGGGGRGTTIIINNNNNNGNNDDDGGGNRKHDAGGGGGGGWFRPGRPLWASHFGGHRPSGGRPFAARPPPSRPFNGGSYGGGGSYGRPPADADSYSYGSDDSYYNGDDSYNSQYNYNSWNEWSDDGGGGYDRPAYSHNAGGGGGGGNWHISVSHGRFRSLPVPQDEAWREMADHVWQGLLNIVQDKLMPGT